MDSYFSFDSLSDELKTKLKECKTVDELREVLADAGMVLDEDVFKAVAGGLGTTDMLADDCRHHKQVCAKDKLSADICKRDHCIDICRVDNNQPFCPINMCPSDHPI